MKKNLLFLLSLLLLFWSETQAQNRTITGKVTASEDGSPIPGATVQVKAAPLLLTQMQKDPFPFKLHQAKLSYFPSLDLLVQNKV